MANKKIIKKESELKSWFIKNYKKLGYSGIVRKDVGECPDLIMLRDGKEIQVELETIASNFLAHKHPLDKVDEVVCVVNDIGLEKPVIVVDELEFEGNGKKKVTLSLESKTYDAFREYCEENAIMLSKKIEIWIDDFLKKHGKEEK